MREITYKQLPSVTYEQELELLAQIYALALESYRKQKAVRPAPESDGRNAAKESSRDDCDATRIIPN
jgi:hypothetical protein